MITCLYCREENPDRARFCNHCGERFDYSRYERKCPDCTHRNAVLATCCANCGATIEGRASIEMRAALLAGVAGEPEEVRFHRAVARGFLARGETTLAIKQLQLAERNDPDNFQTLVELGIAQRRAGDDEGALRALEGALNACEDPPILLALGRKLLDLELPVLARKAFERAGGVASDLGIGRALLMEGKAAEAESVFEAALGSSLVLFEPMVGLASAQLVLGKYESARQLLRKAAEFKVRSPQVLQDLIEKLIAAGESDLALMKVKLSAGTFPANASLHRFFGDVLHHFAQSDSAREEYLQASDACPSDIETLEASRGLVNFRRDLSERLARIGCFPEAAEEIRLAHADRISSFGYCFDMANLFAGLKGHEGSARAHLTRALAFPAADEPIWRYRLALIFDRLGDPLRACEELAEAAVLLDEEYFYEENGDLRTGTDLRVDLACSFYRFGAIERGREQLKEAVRSSITRAEALVRVAESCCDLGEQAIAEALLNLALPLARQKGDLTLIATLENLYARSSGMPTAHVDAATISASAPQ